MTNFIVKKVAVLGAGVMGAQIAAHCINAKVPVVLFDLPAKEGPKNGIVLRAIENLKKLSPAPLGNKDDASLIQVANYEDNLDLLAGCDLIIEAVFEDRDLKAKVSAAAQQVVGADAVIASNTSTLPISGLASAVPDQGKFIGLHFFSPVEKMPLVEIIKGANTSDETLARGFDFVLQIKKTPIVVNDSRGFFTSRVFGTFTNEGITLLGEGVAAPMIETEARKAGMPIGPLAISDEVSLSLMSHIRQQTAKDLHAEGKALPEHPAFAVIDLLLNEYKRPGKAAGGGFYEYPNGGQKYLWPELKVRFEKPGQQICAQDVRDRLLFIQAIETVRCVEEGVLMSTADANIGSIFGIGFAAWTGGALQFINQYGLNDFVARARYLAEQYGERFSPPALLLEKAAQGTTF